VMKIFSISRTWRGSCVTMSMGFSVMIRWSKEARSLNR
jgi:hypothetical protein